MQIFIFIICLLCGVLSGVVYDVLYIARSLICGTNKKEYTVKDKIFIIACDVLYCLVFAAGFVFVSVLFDFDSLRIYMLIGCVLGAFVYLKSIHLIVAFLIKKVYNKLERKLNDVKSRKEKHGERKAQPHRSRRNGKRNIIGRSARRSAGVSADNNRRDNTAARRAKSPN